MFTQLNYTTYSYDLMLQDTLQDIFTVDQFATTEILAVRKYGEIEQKPSHFGRHRK